MTNAHRSWNDLRAEAERLFTTFAPADTRESADKAFDQETIQNAREFIDYAEKHFPAADDIDHGYWPTLCLYWFSAKPHPVDVEIFGSHFEFWRRIDQIVDVSHFDHAPGTPFPTDLAEILRAELR